MTHRPFTKVYWMHALASVHVGTGQGLGFVDLPIVREKVTNWPVIPGSSVKGVLRDMVSRHEEWKGFTKRIFGHSDESGRAGVVSFSDARLVALPVRSLYGTFAYVTSPLVLRRIHRDWELAGWTTGLQVPVPETLESALVPDGSVISDQGAVYLEEYPLRAAVHPEADRWARWVAEALFTSDPAWQRVFLERFMVISDDVFQLICEHGTEVMAHIRIDDKTGTVQEGALWYEESLPAETILSGVCLFQPWMDAEASSMADQVILSGESVVYLGGKSSTGKGQCRVLFQGVKDRG